MLAAMTTIQRRPLRWRITDRFPGRRARRAILAGGGLAVLLIVWLLLLRSYEGRPLILNDDGRSVRQTKVVCPPARTALTADFNAADTSTPPAVRLCVETGRAKAFTALLFGGFVAAAALGLSRLPDQGTGASDTSSWDKAIATARRRQDNRTAPPPPPSP